MQMIHINKQQILSIHFLEGVKVSGTIGTTLPFTLTNLTCLRIRTYHLRFHQFEMFIRQEVTNFDAY
jgi:hypothetical protein